MRNKLYIFLFFAGFSFLATKTVAQSQSDMRINEILVINTDDYEDDFGHKHGWIELFNKSQGTVDIGGCYISNDPKNLKKYRIPKGDVLTKIKPRQHVVLWADNMPLRGTFHVNFTLDATDMLYLISSNGRDIIDSVRIPKGTGPFPREDYVSNTKGIQIITVDHIDSYPKENISYGRLLDGDDELGWAFLVKTTPSSNNVILDSEAAAQRFVEFDPYGLVMSVTAMSVVFIALILLYIIFKNVGNASIKASRKKMERAGLSPAVATATEEASGEVFAAIATSIHLYIMQEEAHDVENTILTINKVARTYSPWNSKIYGLREMPNKNKH
jgi:Na+-transporting methylmalonyl-CoA/oxaloacetate decarboxylase gamma subunit